MQRVCVGRQVKCQQHDLKLYPSWEGGYNGQYYNVSFCVCKHEKVGRRQGKGVKSTKNVTFPIFNHDNNFSTPAFILHSERNYYQSEGSRMKLQHQKKMEDYTQSKAEMNVPKPRSKNNYCSVCKNNYDDYLEHIHSEHHKRKINQSNFNKDILELTTKYNTHTDKMTRTITSTSSILDKNISVTRIEDDSDSVQIISNPNKKIKQNQYIPHPYPIHRNQINQYPFPNNYPNTLSNINQYPLQVNNPINPPPQTNKFPPSINAFSMINGFKPFSSTYQQQMNQFILNLNIIFNPYPHPNPILTPFEVGMQAKQQLNMLQYSLMNQIEFCNNNSRMKPAPPPPAPKGTWIVIDD